MSVSCFGYLFCYLNAQPQVTQRNGQPNAKASLGCFVLFSVIELKASCCKLGFIVQCIRLH